MRLLAWNAQIGVHHHAKTRLSNWNAQLGAHHHTVMRLSNWNAQLGVDHHAIMRLSKWSVQGVQGAAVCVLNGDAPLRVGRMLVRVARMRCLCVCSGSSASPCHVVEEFHGPS
jgi:hypothetical protein